MARKKVDGRSVRLTPEQRAERNELILNYYLAGRSMRWIGAHPKVQLSGNAVHGIVHSGLKRLAEEQGLVTESALTIYVGRLEMLLGVTMPKAMGGDLKAIEVGRRLLENYARLYDLAEERSVNIIPPMSDDELSLIDEDSEAFAALDDLTKYRLRQHKEAHG